MNNLRRLASSFVLMLLLLFPSGTVGAAGKRAVSVCCLLEAMRLFWLALKGG